jgi:hypothetical protein
LCEVGRQLPYHSAGFLAVSLDGVHLHDLRHASNHLVAEAGASLRELMERIGHATSRAALIYLRSTDDRQRTLAEALSERARRDLAGESLWHETDKLIRPSIGSPGAATRLSPRF